MSASLTITLPDGSNTTAPAGSRPIDIAKSIGQRLADDAVVARVNGTAMGGGIGLVAVCDIAIAAESARFAFSEVKLGIAPAAISPYVVRKIGETNARVLFTTGERFSAARAHTIGLVHAVVPPEQLDDAVDKALHELLSSAPTAIRVCKTLALTIGSMNYETARSYNRSHFRVMRACVFEALRREVRNFSEGDLPFDGSLVQVVDRE